MSFVKKVVRGIVDFVKKYWKEIVIVAAVVFTAGVATIGGWSAFTTVAGEQGFMSAIGSTMWAGVTGTAGSMGIGTGAKGAAAVQMGVEGGGLGAGLGWGSQGLGVGMTAGEYGANAAALNVPAERAAANAAVQSVKAGASSGMPAAQQASVGFAEAQAGAAPGAYAGTTAGKNILGPEGAPTVAGEGMSTGEALMWSSAIQTGAGLAQGYSQGKMYEESLPKAMWLADLGRGGTPYTGPLPGAPMPGIQPGPQALGAPGPSLAGAVAAAEDPALASVRAPFAPLMSGNQPFTPGQRPGASMTPQPLFQPPNQPLMGGGSP